MTVLVNDDIINELLNIYHSPAPVGPTSPQAPAPPLTTRVTSCQVGGGVDLAMQDFAEEFDTLVYKPLDLLTVELEAAQAVAKPQVDLIFNQFDSLIAVSLPTNKLQLKTDVLKSIDAQPLTPTEVQVNSLGINDLLGQMGLPLVNDNASAETALQIKGLYVVNGLWLKGGNLDFSCVKTLHRLLGGNPCETFTPLLSKGRGTFSFVCTTKVVTSATAPHPCPPATFHNACVADEADVEVEITLATDAQIDAILASNTHLTRDDLNFYIFWNDTLKVDTQTINELKLLGFTDTEITDITTFNNVGPVKVCLIKDTVGVLDFICARPDDAAAIVENGPDGIDPDPSIDDVIDDIINSMTNPPRDIPGLAEHGNIPLWVAGTIDLNKTFTCRADLSSALADAEEGLADAGNAVGFAFDQGNAALQTVQSTLTGISNEISNLLTAATDLTSEFPGSLLGCLFPGSGFGLSLPFPKIVISGLDLAFSILVDQVLGVFNGLEALLSSLLIGVCISASILGAAVVAGPVAGAAVAVTSDLPQTVGGAAGASLGLADGMGCAAHELEWPIEITETLQCLLKLLRMLEDMINAAIGFIRNLITTIQALGIEFGFRLEGGIVCTPAESIAAIAAIQAALVGA